jgi:predicted acetylornithine/succinylornithine family transaminase
VSGADPRGALLGVYRVPDLLFVKGEGSHLIDEEGRRYLDFTSGIAVNALGYNSPVVRGAIERALESGLIHTSNLFRTRPAEELAELLVAHSFPGRTFFCNSGAEAGEAGFKFARRWARSVGGDAKIEFISFNGAFHGRLFGTLAATDRPDYRTPFEPLMPGVRFATMGDLASVEALMSRERTAAVVIEPIQGEGGVYPVPAAFLQGLRALCDAHEVALIVDEVQCGVGRTGIPFAYQESGIQPDILTLAKPLGGGLPIGAVVLAPHVAATIQPGDHGTTFGGGPFVASVALEVLRTVFTPGFLAEVRHREHTLCEVLAGLLRRSPRVRAVRGRGLMWGIELDGPVADVVTRARAAGLLLVGAGPSVIRILPPLNITDDELRHGLALLEGVLGEGA